VANHSGGVGSVVANHRGGGEISMVVTTLKIKQCILLLTFSATVLPKVIEVS